MYSSNDTSTKSEEANLSFMASNEGSSNDSIRVFFTDSRSYDQFFLAFHETHKEANRLVVIGNKLKISNSFLESKAKSLEKELHDAQAQLVNLELICLHASCKCVKSSKM